MVGIKAGIRAEGCGIDAGWMQEDAGVEIVCEPWIIRKRSVEQILL